MQDSSCVQLYLSGSAADWEVVPFVVVSCDVVMLGSSEEGTAELKRHPEPMMHS